MVLNLVYDYVGLNRNLELSGCENGIFTAVRCLIISVQNFSIIDSKDVRHKLVTSLLSFSSCRKCRCLPVYGIFCDSVYDFLVKLCHLVKNVLK